MRRPARLERAGALTPRDRIWAAIRGFGAGGITFFSAAEIMVISEQRADTTLTYLRALAIAGFLVEGAARHVTPRRRELNLYRLARDVGVEAPHLTEDGKPCVEHLGQQQMWSVMRKTKGAFDWRELVQACPHPVTLHLAKVYLRLLGRAGYLVVSRKARGTIPARYCFIRARDTGPRAPIISQHRSVVDGNSGEVMFEAK